MDDDKAESKEVQEAREILKKAPVIKEGDVISRQQLAESFAKISGNTSEENVQKYLKLLDGHDEFRRASPKERRYKLFALILCLLAILSIVIQVLGVISEFKSFSLLFSCFSLVFWLKADEEQIKRTRKNLPHSRRIKF
mgnify:CR=1 FL=1